MYFVKSLCRCGAERPSWVFQGFYVDGSKQTNIESLPNALLLSQESCCVQSRRAPVQFWKWGPNRTLPWGNGRWVWTAVFPYILRGTSPWFHGRSFRRIIQCWFHREFSIGEALLLNLGYCLFIWLFSKYWLKL